MPKKYWKLTLFMFIIIIFLTFILLKTKSNTDVTMCSIFIPIIVGYFINYDNKQKEKRILYHKQLYLYIEKYYDILSNQTTKENMGEKHNMIEEICDDILTFLNKNIKYANEETVEILSCANVYKYKNYNEFQDNYFVNKVIPVLLKEIIEFSNALDFLEFLKIKLNIGKSRVLKRKALTRLYVDSLLISLVSEMNYCTTLRDTIEYYNIFDEYTNENINIIYKIKKYIIKNKKLKLSDLIKKLKRNYNVPIRKIRH